MLENRAINRSPIRVWERRPSGENAAIEAEARSRLQTSGYPQLRKVSCEFHEGVLTLQGQVSTFHLKQIAQTLVRRLEGVGEINNGLEVAVQPSMKSCCAI
jgi:osmotically-inducible protein OsmY